MARTALLTYADLQAWPENPRGQRYELIDGDLYVTAAPVPRHQLVVGRIFLVLSRHVERHGGAAYLGPIDVKFAEDTVVEPDLIHLAPGHLDRVGRDFVHAAPDLVVEVSSPSTRAIDLGRKRELYDAQGIAEYWFADLRADRLVVHRRDPGYDRPTTLAEDDTLTSSLLPGLAVPVGDLLGVAL